MLGKKRLFQLDPRLSLCARMVRQGSRVADIGTDHAYLPIWLVRQGVAERAIAADIRLGPLQKAAMNVKRHLVQGQVDTRLSDGLEQVFPHEADDIVIAGMGGELMAQIIGKAPWLKDSEKRLILQPMSSARELRVFLAQEGYAVQQEQAVFADGRVYTVLQAAYDPQHVPDHPLYPEIGLLDGSTPESRAYLQRVCQRLRQQAQGLAHTGQHEQAARLLEQVKAVEALCGTTEGEGQ